MQFFRNQKRKRLCLHRKGEGLLGRKWAGMDKKRDRGGFNGGRGHGPLSVIFPIAINCVRYFWNEKDNQGN